MSLNIYNYIVILTSIIVVCFLILLYIKRSSRQNSLSMTSLITLDLLNEIIILVNTSNKIIFINKAGEKLLKIPKKEITGKDISKIFADPSTKLSPDLSKLNLKSSGGEILPLSLIVNQITNKNNKPIGYGLILKIIGDKEKYSSLLLEKTSEIVNMNNLLEKMKQNKEKKEQNIEQKLNALTFDMREEYIRLHAAINNLSFGYIIIDKEKNITLTNETIKNLFPTSNQQNITTLEELQKNIKEGINLSEGIGHVLKTGISLFSKFIQINNKYIDIFISPIILTENNISQTIGSTILTQDKTEKRITEKSEEDFFAIASHELRTPLTAIRGYISLIKQLFFKDIKNEELKKIIIDLDTSSSRLINIVNDFLDTSKLQQGKIIVKKEPCDLLELINSSIKETNSIAMQKKLFLNFNNKLASAVVLGDREKIRQVIINLISNGLKYTEQGGVTINIEKTDNSQYKIFIRDTGKGISQENKNLLFNKFQRINPVKGSHMISSGLGLYISKMLIDKMNGIIKLENTELGKGSTFSLTLPAYKQ